MIKNFPEFGQLELSDKDEILKLTQGFHYYSDFSFTNLWSRDTGLIKRGFARLNGNLVIRMINYKTNQPFFSICGSHLQNETVDTLWKVTKKEYDTLPLRLIPQEFIEQVTLPGINKEEDRDSFDYIYLVEEWKSFAGGDFKQKRNEVNTLLAEHPEIEAKELDIRNPSIKKEISCLFYGWAKNKIASGDEYQSNERSSFNNLLILVETYGLTLVGMYIKEKMIAFIVCEIVSSDYAIGYFAKTDSSIKGANAYLLQSLARILSAKGVTYFNYEEDMGLKNLRTAKMRFRPVSFLKKYTIDFQ